jgi:hypothetical protein
VVEKWENLDAMNGGVVGVFIAPTTKCGRWWSCLLDGAPDSPVPLPRHHCRWILTVGASDFWAPLGVRCTPDMYCLMSGAPVWACLTSARAARALNAPQGAVGAEKSRCSAGSPDSPVHTGQSGEF